MGIIRKRSLAGGAIFCFLMTFSLPAQELWLRHAPAKISLYEDNVELLPQRKEKGYWSVFFLREGQHEYRISAKGYKSKHYQILAQKGKVLKKEWKLERQKSSMQFKQMIPTGRRPKSAWFSSDGSVLYMPLLDDAGVSRYRFKDQSHQILKPEGKGFQKKKGFVELTFLNQGKDVWVSQMTTGRIHVWNGSDGSYKKNFKSGGIWSKVLLPGKDEDLVFVSNWVSKDVTALDSRTGKVVWTCKTDGIPRGLALSRDQRRLYVCLFDQAGLNVIKTRSGEKLDYKTYASKGAFRHILNRQGDLLVSDMYNNRIWFIREDTLELSGSVKVAANPNTIALNPVDSRWLYVSCRGRNNPESYYLKGPEFGKIMLIHTDKKRVEDWQWGMNQPTGLAVSPEGNQLVVTDFLDNQAELYDISAYLEK